MLQILDLISLARLAGWELIIIIIKFCQIHRTHKHFRIFEHFIYIFAHCGGGGIFQNGSTQFMDGLSEI